MKHKRRRPDGLSAVASALRFELLSIFWGEGGSQLGYTRSEDGERRSRTRIFTDFSIHVTSS